MFFGLFVLYFLSLLIVIVFDLNVVATYEEEYSYGCTLEFIGYYNESGQFVNASDIPVGVNVLVTMNCESESFEELQKTAEENNLTIDEYGNIKYSVVWTNKTGELLEK